MTRPLGATGGFTELDPLTADPDSVADDGEENHVTTPLAIRP